MGLRDRFFGNRRAGEKSHYRQTHEPVNYDSVLEWLLGLNQKDYDKLLKVVEVYREANKNEAKILNVKVEFDTQLIHTEPADEPVDSELDGYLEQDSDDLIAAFGAAEKPTKAKKAKQ